MRRWLFVCLFVLVAAPVFAQTHPCDATIPTNPAVASPVKVGFCVPQTDAQNATAYKVYMDGSSTPVFNNLLTPIGSPSTSGKVYLQTPGIAVMQGPHSVQVATVNPVGEGAKSAAYPFDAIALPVAPDKVRIAP